MFLRIQNIRDIPKKKKIIMMENNLLENSKYTFIPNLNENKNDNNINLK